MMKLGLLTVLIVLVSVVLLVLTGLDSVSFVQAQGPDAQNVQLVGHLGGTTEAVFIQGNYAYIGEGPSLVIMNISNPASPTVVGKTTPLPDIVRGIYFSGSYAYVVVGDKGLWNRRPFCPNPLYHPNAYPNQYPNAYPNAYSDSYTDTTTTFKC